MLKMINLGAPDPRLLAKVDLRVHPVLDSPDPPTIKAKLLADIAVESGCLDALVDPGVPYIEDLVRMLVDRGVAPVATKGKVYVRIW